MTYNTPVQPSITNMTASSFTVTINPDGNPVGTWYAIQIQTVSAISWVNTSGFLQPTIIFQQPNNNSLTIFGLIPNQSYFITLIAAADSLGTNASLPGTAASVVTPTLPFVFPNALTLRQQMIVTKSRELMPEAFSANVQDEKILAFVEVVLADINVWSPLTGYSTEDAPDVLLPILYFGVIVFSELLYFQAQATLQDFDYNDNGLTVNVQQVPRIDINYKNLLAMYRTMVENFKKSEMFKVGGKGVGTPRYQSQIGQFLKIALGSAFTWNQ
jgi:hypothetical protein